MYLVVPAPDAIFASLHPVGIILLIFGRYVVARLAFRTRQRNDYAVLFAFSCHLDNILTRSSTILDLRYGSSLFYPIQWMVSS